MHNTITGSTASPSRHKHLMSVLLTITTLVMVASFAAAFITWRVESTQVRSVGAAGSSAADAALPVLASVTIPSTPAQGVRPSLPLTQPGKVPAYTLDDVRRYFLAYPEIAGPARVGSVVELRQLQFMTREQASARMHGESLNEVAPGAIVCYLRFTGMFSANDAVIAPVSALPGKEWMHTTELVIDGTTGKILVWGIYP